MTKGANDRSVVYFDAGFQILGGDDTIWNNITTADINAIRFERSGYDIFEVGNDGTLTVSPTASPVPTSPSVFIKGRPDTGTGHGKVILRLDDADNSDNVLDFKKTTTGSSYAADIISGASNHADTEAIRLTHNSYSDTVLGSVLSVGRTGSSGTYQEILRVDSTGPLNMTGNSPNFLWDTDGAGDIGASGDNRPGNIYAETQVVADGSVLKQNAVDLGPAADTTKTITALQNSTSPGLRYNSGTSVWQFSNDGTLWNNMGDDTAPTWDEIYAGDKTLDIDDTVLTFSQSSTSGYGLYITRNLPYTSTDQPIVYMYNENATDDKPTLRIKGQGDQTNTFDLTFSTAAASTSTSNVANFTLKSLAGGVAASFGMATLNIGITDHASDNGSAQYWGLYVSPGNNGSAEKRAIQVSSGIDLEHYAFISSSGKIEHAQTITNGMSGVTRDLQKNSVTSGGTGLASSDMVRLLHLEFIGDTDDNAFSSVYGAYFTGDTVGTGATTTGFAIDANWDEGFTSAVKSSIKVSQADGFSGTTQAIFTSQVTSTGTGLASSDDVRLLYLDFNGDPDDSGFASVYGAYFEGDTAGTGATTTGVAVDANWDYSISAAAKGLIAISQADGFGSSSHINLHSQVTSTGTGLAASDAVKLFTANYVSDAGDHASSTVYGLHCTTDTTGSAIKVGVRMDGSWYYGWWSNSKTRLSVSQTDGFGGIEVPLLSDEFTSVGTGLDSGDVLISYKATIVDNPSDGDAEYWGFAYMDNPDNGSVAKYAFGTDTSLTVDDYSLFMQSGPAYLRHDFLTNQGKHLEVVTATDGIASASGSLAVVTANLAEDGVSADSSYAYGFYAARDATYSPPTTTAFRADANWDYGLYVDTADTWGVRAYKCGVGVAFDTMPTIVPDSDGAVYVDLRSSSGVTSGNHLGVSSQYDRHASDTSGGTIYLFVADANNATSGSAFVNAYYAGRSCSRGIYSASQYNQFRRQAGDWNSTVQPVVSITNESTTESSPQHALKATLAESNAGVFAVALDNTANTSTTIGTKYHIGFTEAKSIRRAIATSTFLPDYPVTAGSGEDFRYVGNSASSYWTTYGTTDNSRYLTIPLDDVPNGATIKNLSLVVLNQVSSAPTTTNRAYIQLYRQPLGSATPTSISGPHYSDTYDTPTTVASGTLTITLDKTTYSYFVRYRNPAVNVDNYCNVYSFWTTYQITDIGDAIG
jgi:hypothetical protein